VLIEGPTGSGKELVAKAVHNLSTRAGRRFVAVNCGALPDTLLESELFGYKKGAFTDANKDKPGRFAMAEGGTLFLDEISDISTALQVKLLRVLQEKEYEPLGATTTVKANVRVIAATNKRLSDQVARGAFREDLYYRLNVVRIALPPLADRREDIPLLVNHFIRQFNAEQAKRIEGISEEALALLLRHSFPGNVRELQNVIEHAVVLSHSDIIDVDEEQAMETAKKIIRLAIDNFARRDPARQNIPKVQERLVAGFTTEVVSQILGGKYRPSYRPLNDGIQAGRLRGVAGVVGCNNPKFPHDEYHLAMVKESACTSSPAASSLWSTRLCRFKEVNMSKNSSRKHSRSTSAPPGPSRPTRSKPHT